MAEIQHVCFDEIIGYFDELEDPRSTVNQKHPLVSVVIISMMAVLAEQVARRRLPSGPAAKAEFLSKVLNLRTGSHARMFFGACLRCSSQTHFKLVLRPGCDRCVRTRPRRRTWTSPFSRSMARRAAQP